MKFLAIAGNIVDSPLKALQGFEAVVWGLGGLVGVFFQEEF